jgi:hypothetical protein
MQHWNCKYPMIEAEGEDHSGGVEKRNHKNMSPNQPRALKSPHRHPPAIIGRLRLSSTEPKSSASATPENRPAHIVTIAKPTHPLKTFPPSALPPLNVFDIPASQDHVKLSLIGPRYVQNPAATAAPVSEAAMKPAKLLRGARGRPKSRAGSGGVSGPQSRPKVDAAVSAQERLLK